MSNWRLVPRLLNQSHGTHIICPLLRDETFISTDDKSSAKVEDASSSHVAYSLSHSTSFSSSETGDSLDRLRYVSKRSAEKRDFF